ncbi:4-alpha-glucanotransferase [Actinomyces sp. B33]|uniref:4-alpha-glucanotransferase n=1 Tax=Actinomyces sp. B33 TaxID=2942131 RepID=UPI002340DC31|nr:4-alpha-glucanotransferase [Actinomyces sp. B33]MDC4232911.1 4-alpha-glucanotransferase [Actinomyces sp. B33]
MTTDPAAIDIDALRRLADLHGVATGYWDFHGRRVDVEAQSLLAVLGALGAPVDGTSDDEDIRSALRAAEDAPWTRVLAPTVVVRRGNGPEIPVNVPHGSWVTLTWVCEDGASGECAQVDRWVEPHEVDGQLIGRATFLLPDDLPLGYHRLVATVEGGLVDSSTLIVVPDALEHPLLSQDQRAWGVSAQMYSTRSASSWGVGDAADLSDLVAVCADRGADFLLINPVHASQPILPVEDSPYLPVSRRWINPLYIRPEAIPEYALLPDASRRAVEELRLETSQWNTGSDLIDRDRSWEAKRKALDVIFSAGRAGHRDSLFRRFIADGGPDLANFALWCAMVEDSGSMHLPGDLAKVSSTTVDRMRFDMADRVEFWQWCQWVVAEQLADAHRVGLDLGMRVGLMADLAVGVHPSGSEPWASPEFFASGMSVGAPPDMYSQQGQNWSQHPWSPRALADAGYAPLRDMVRAALANAGAVRIDHILGLFRLWWIPEGGPADRGTYVYYDHEAMVGVVLLEATRAGALVIGEDLGVVEPWVRDYLRDRGVLGTAVVWFEKDSAGWPLHPGDYRRECLAAVNIHDLPPTGGYLAGVQTTLRDELGLLVEDVEDVRDRDRLELEKVVARLREYDLIRAAEPSEKDLVEALYAYVAATPARLVVASLVDAVGDHRPQNMPGTHLEYPNWRIPLCDAAGVEVPVEDLASNERLTSLFALLQSALG